MPIIRYKKIVPILSFALLSLFIAFPQTYNSVDSLKKVLVSHTHIDTSKVNLLNKLAYELHRLKPQEARLYAEQSRKMADQLNYPKGKATSLWNIGLSNYASNKQLALRYFKQALLLAEQVNDQEGICNYLLAIGNVTYSLGDVKASDQAFSRGLQIASTLKEPSIYIKMLYSIASNLTRKGQYLEAVAKYQQVIDRATETNNKMMLSRAYTEIGSIFQRQGNSPQALEYQLSSLHLCEQDKDLIGIFNALVAIANIKSTLNECESALGNAQQAFQIAKEMKDSSMLFISLTQKGNIYHQMKHPEALRYLKEALQMVQGRKINKTVKLLSSIGSVYTEQGKFSEAEKSLDEALNMAQKAELKSAQGEILRTLGLLYFTQKQYACAIDYANRALRMGSEMPNQELMKECYQLLSDIYVATGNYPKAYRSYRYFKQLNDELLNDKNVRNITLLESAYKYDKEKQAYEAEKANRQLKIKNQRNLIFALTVIAILVLLLLYQFYLSNQLKKKALQLEICQINSKLEYSQKEMTFATLKLMQNSESDAYSMKMLQKIENSTNEEGKENVRSLIGYYKNKSTYSNWEEFEMLFLQVNSDFYDKLNERFPTLTLNERKLCVFLKLNMSNKDIAQITFQSEEALKKARMRLRKKLEMDRDESLTGFIQSL